MVMVIYLRLQYKILVRLKHTFIIIRQCYKYTNIQYAEKVFPIITVTSKCFLENLQFGIFCIFYLLFLVLVINTYSSI